jgi:hypothetical protein
MSFIVDATHKDYKTYSANLTRILGTISSQLPNIIKAADANAAAGAYDTTVKTINNRGLDLVVRLNAEAFAKTKEKMGLTAAWPPFISGYVSPLDRLNPNGDLSLYRTY